VIAPSAFAETPKPTVVLVHGAFADSSSWNGVIRILKKDGYPVLAVANPLRGVASDGAYVSNALDSIKGAVVLVGHSYGGFVITGVAEEIAGRIASIVYVDAFIPSDGQAFADFSPEWNLPPDALIPAPPAVVGDYRDEADLLWVNEKATPQPAGTFTERARVTGAYKTIPSKTFVQATGWDSPFKEAVAGFRADAGWRVHEVACGHDIAIEEPDELTGILEKAA
jgi:pimeloyl-ACP methyl ester carboxylesterase